MSDLLRLQAKHVLPGCNFLTVAEIARADRAQGGHWFSAGAMQFFDGRLGRLFGGRFLVNSTQFHASDGWTPGRRWHIAYWFHTGAGYGVDGLPGAGSVFLEWATEEAAEQFAEQLEAGRPSIERLDYTHGLPCSYLSCSAHAVWAITGPGALELLCAQHFAHQLLEHWGASMGAA